MKKFMPVVLSVLLLAVFTPCFVSPAGAEPASAEWMTDIAQAMRKAQDENKMVFLDFTGSDWCIWCKRLDAEILSQKQFKEYAAQNLVLVLLDFPKNKPQTAELKNQNQKLAQQYKIQGFPTIIVLDKDGKAVGKLGYMRGGPDPFIEALEKIKSK